MGAVNQLSITIDGGELLKGIDKLTGLAADAAFLALVDLGHEILRLAEKEVPHDTGALQNSGTVVPSKGEGVVRVGFNKPYAARLHEHPEFRFQKGRKGKYLEDPIKSNLPEFNSFYGRKVKGVMNV